MEIILYFSVALIAIAFLVLVIYLSKTLKSLQGTLQSVSTTLSGLEKQLDGVTKETTELLQKTNALAEDIQEKSQNLNSVVTAVKDVGATVSKFNGSLRNLTNSFDIHVEENKEKVSQIVQWSNIFFELKDKWNEKKEAKKASNTEAMKRVRSR
ncbi:DUF948 domain-containing protein [Neobacillus vireti]|uniref:DUF948 domain-containing protein n=1 Tax=Neobacillus vireti TaxID=220686 RepID=UPI002FFF6F10